MLSDQNLACSYTFFHFLLRILGVCGGQCCMRHVSSCVLSATKKVRGIPWDAEKATATARGGLVLGQKEGGGGRRNPPRHTSLPTPPKLFLGEKIIQWFSFYKNISLSFLCVQISNLVAWLFKYFSQLWRLCCYRICMSWPLWHRHKKKKKEKEEEVAEQKKPVLERIPRKKEEPDSNLSSPPLASSLLSHSTGEQEVPYSAWKIMTHEMTEGLTWRILRLMITAHEEKATHLPQKTENFCKLCSTRKLFFWVQGTWGGGEI